MPPKFFFISLLSSFIFSHSYGQCLDHQNTLLLLLKNELIFNSSISTKLVQWNQTDDCCKWYGVECDVKGRVTSLQLDHEAISGGIGDSSSLFRLKHLEKLNLAYNAFNSSTGIPIPKGIGNLTNLTHLNLSNVCFVGQVPTEISLLRRLVSLDISGEFLSLEHPNLEMILQNLTGIRELYLDFVNITSSYERRNWSHIISSYLPNLTTLNFRGCGLSGPLCNSFRQLHSLSVLRLDGNNLSTTDPDSFANFSSLTILTLADCKLKGFFPNMIFHIPTLQVLNLYWNKQLSGSIPPFTQNGSLKSIVLSCTNFSGLIPSSINNLNTLLHIDLSGCQFTGSIPSTFSNMSALIHVDLSNNLLTGSLSSTLFQGLPNLVSLDLSCNHLEGPIPDSFFQLQSLEYLSLSKNLFNGTFQLNKIQSLVSLRELDLSDNNVSVDVVNDNSSAYGLPLLEVLRLPSCNMSKFPDFIRYYEIRELDLSNNQIVGEIPSWIWGRHLQRLNLSFNLLMGFQQPYHIPASLQSLILHSNELKGELDLPFPPEIGNTTFELSILSLSSNRFSGSIPTSLCSATHLSVLDLSVNKLSGAIPSCILENTMILRVINLGQNNLIGHIPDHFSPNCSLNYFDLNNNTLEGKIPESLKSCKLLEVLNVGNNLINDSFPCMQSSSLRVLVLHSNRFYGKVMCHNSWPDLQILDISSNNFSGSLESTNFSSWRAMVLENDTHLGYYYLVSFGTTSGVKLILKGLEERFVKIWAEFNVIDFSCNKFHGEIPNTIGDLNSLHVLNFSHNVLNGSIPKSFGQLRKLESLDLSRNQLSGEIPVELVGLTFLEVLDLSYNKLVGMIPNGRQLQTFSADSYKGNSELCGFPLKISCSHTHDSGEHESEQEKSEIEWEYVFAALGYVVGLGSFVWLLVFCRSFRGKYFGKIEDVVEEIINGRRRRKRRRCARIVLD